MKIAVLSSSYLPETDGAAIATHYHACFLARQEHEVIFVRPSFPANWEGVAQPHLALPPMRHLEYPGVPLLDANSRLPSCRDSLRAASELSSFRPDLVVYHDPERMVPLLTVPFLPKRVLGLATFRRSPCKVVAVHHTEILRSSALRPEWYLRNGLARKLNAWTLSRIYNRFDAAVFVSDQSEREARSVGITAPGVRGYNGVDGELFSPRRELRPAELTLCVVGRLAYEKSSNLIPHFVRELSKLTGDFRVVVIGDGYLRHELRAACKDMPRISFLGNIPTDQVAARMNEASFLLSFSAVETDGLVTKEALCCGVPIIAPNAMGSAQWLHRGVGLIYDPSWLTPDGMGTLAKAVIDQLPQHAEWEKNALALREELSWDRALRQTYAGLGKALGLSIVNPVDPTGEARRSRSAANLDTD